MSLSMSYSPKAKEEPDYEPELDELLEEDSGSDDENPNHFKIRGALPEYTETKLTIRQLHDVVWTETKQTFLIHSLFHNFYVPPIVFAVHPAEDDPNEEVRIPFKDPKSKKQWWFTLPQSSRGVKAELPELDRERFLGHLLTCDCPEKLQALSSPWAQWIRELERRHVGVEGGLATVLEWDTKRGRDFQNIAYLVCCCDYLPVKEEMPTATSMMKWIERDDPPTEQFKNDIRDVLVDFWNIGNDNHLNYGLKNIGSRIAPVEFIFVGVLLYIMRKKPMEERAAAITALRKGIRAEHSDIRLNTKVCRSMWTLIRRVQNASKSASHSQHDSKGKRRRKEDDEEDDEYRPMPLSGLSGKSAHTRSKKRTVLS
ncbi:hypothetical protein C0995_011589 [Termitomyces sp. Mi166|nr:hypothetical protein C0995_011589 [Termitomyces sp. Mi166\